MILDFHRCDKKFVIIDFNRLIWLINRQISGTIEYYRLHFRWSISIDSLRPDLDICLTFTADMIQISPKLSQITIQSLRSLKTLCYKTLSQFTIKLNFIAQILYSPLFLLQDLWKPDPRPIFSLVRYKKN